jgi:hypothetical protein
MNLGAEWKHSKQLNSLPHTIPKGYQIRDPEANREIRLKTRARTTFGRRVNSQETVAKVQAVAKPVISVK